VDALDECHSGIRGDIIQALDYWVPLLPKNVKIFLTSRTQEDIAVYMEKLSSKTIHIKIGLDEDDGDLKSFFEHQLKGIRADKGLERTWPDDALASDVIALAQKACGLFQWGSVACAMIRSKYNPHTAVQHILSLKSNDGALDTLYTESLYQAFPEINGDLELRQFYTQVISAIVAAKEPLGIVSIAELANVGINDVE
jgi:hypothetical protein